MSNKETARKSLLVTMADKYGMETNKFMTTLKATIFPSDREATNEQVAAFLVVAREYKLNPFIREIYAFPTKGGGITPIVPIDGWTHIINDHAQFDGMKLVDTFDEKGGIHSVTCIMFRKDRDKPTEVTEYYDECVRPTDPWKRWPKRMLRHKAVIQCARYAFGFAGIYDPDEGERIKESEESMSDTGRMKSATEDKVEELKKKMREDETVDAEFTEENDGEVKEPEGEKVDSGVPEEKESKEQEETTDEEEESPEATDEEREGPEPVTDLSALIDFSASFWNVTKGAALMRMNERTKELYQVASVDKLNEVFIQDFADKIRNGVETYD